MTGQWLLSMVLLLTFSADIGLSWKIYNLQTKLSECSGQLTYVNYATLNINTAASMTCLCNITSYKMPWMGFAFKADVEPRGRVSNVCVSHVGKPNILSPLRKVKVECINRYTHFSRDPVFCGWYICIKVFFKHDGSSVLRLNTHSGDTFNIECAIDGNPSTPTARTTTEVASKKPSTPTTEKTTPEPEVPSTTTSTTTTTTEKATSTPQPELSTDAITMARRQEQ